MATDDSRQLVIYLSPIPEESRIERTVVSVSPTREVEEGMKVASGCTDGIQTVRKKRKADTPELRDFIDCKELKDSDRQSGDLVVCIFMKRPWQP